MLFTQLPDMPNNMTDNQIAEANNWLANNVAIELWITAQVCAEFKISQARLAQLCKSEKIPGHIQMGTTHVYIMRYARAWFEAYVARVHARASKREAKATTKEKKPTGRPKKNVNAWRDFTYQDIAYHIDEEFASVHLYIQYKSLEFRKMLEAQGHVYGSPEFAQYLEWMAGFKEAAGYKE